MDGEETLPLKAIRPQTIRFITLKLTFFICKRDGTRFFLAHVQMGGGDLGCGPSGKTQGLELTGC